MANRSEKEEIMRRKVTKNGKTVHWDIVDYEKALEKAEKALENSIVLGDDLPGGGWVTIGVYKSILERNRTLARALDLACGGDQGEIDKHMAMAEEERRS